MASKWAKLKEKFMQYVEPPEYQQLIDKVRQAKVADLVDAGTHVGRHVLLVTGGLNTAEYKAIKGKSFRELDYKFTARLFASLKAEKKELEERIKKLNVGLEACEQDLVQVMEDDELSKFELAGVTYFTKIDPYASFEDGESAPEHEFVVGKGKNKQVLRLKGKEATYHYFRQLMPEIFTINYQTLSAIVKERLEQGGDLPPGVKVFLKTSVNMRGAKAATATE